MKIRPRAVTTALSATALLAGVLIGAANPAAATAPPWGADANELGQLHFYNSAGTEVRSGNTADDPFALYAVATTDDPHTTNTAATLYAYTPVQGVLPINWSGEQLSATTTFPVVDPSAPTVVKNAGAHRPVVTIGTTAHGVINLAGYIADIPNTDTTTNYPGLYELRLRTAGNDPKYWAAVIHVDSGTGAWTVTYPDANVTQDNTSLSIGASTTINYGGSTKLSTTLKDTTTTHVLAAQQVKLYKRPNTSSAWTFVANATTNSSGVASNTQSPHGKTLYQWRYAGDSTHKSATSGTETVSVRQVVSARSTKTSVAHGVTFKIYGTVNPPSSGAKVSLQRQSGTKWTTVTTVTIKKQALPNGKTSVGFVFSVKQTSKGTYKYRVTKAATSTLLAGTSSTLTVKVT